MSGLTALLAPREAVRSLRGNLWTITEWSLFWMSARYCGGGGPRRGFVLLNPLWVFFLFVFYWCPCAQIHAFNYHNEVQSLVFTLFVASGISEPCQAKHNFNSLKVNKTFSRNCNNGRCPDEFLTSKVACTQHPSINHVFLSREGKSPEKHSCEVNFRQEKKNMQNSIQNISI